MPEIADVLRTVNLLIALVVFSWLAIRRVQHPDWYPRGGLRRDLWTMAFLWDLALIVGTTEQLVDSDTYIRVGLAMAAVMTTLAILIRPRSEWPKPDWKEREESR